MFATRKTSLYIGTRQAERCAHGCVGMCGYAWAGNDAATFVESFLLRVVNMLTLFLRRQVQRHVIEIRQAGLPPGYRIFLAAVAAGLPHLSFCPSTAIIHCLLSLYTANRTFTQAGRYAQLCALRARLRRLWALPRVGVCVVMCGRWLGNYFHKCCQVTKTKFVLQFVMGI